MSFGFSPGDVVMFGNFLLKVRGALKEDDGSRIQYLRATKQCEDFDAVLASIRRLDLSNATESFKEQLAQCAFNTQGVINEFRQTVARYEKSMGESSSRGRIASAPRKIQWAFDAADDLDDFRKRLQSQLDRIQITLQSNVWEMMAKLEQRTQFLDSPRGLVLAPRGVSVRHNPWMAGGSTAVPLLREPVYQNVDFIGDLLFGRFFTNEPPPPGPGIGRAFTLPDDDSGAMAMTIMFPRPLPPSNESKSVSGPSQRSTHASSPPEQPVTPARRLKQNARTELRDEINELLRSLDLEELSPNEERQLRVPPTPQFVLESPPTRDSPAGGAQSTTFMEEPSPAREEGLPADEEPRKSRHFAIPKFSGSRGDGDPLRFAATLVGVISIVDSAARLATGYRSLSSENGELLQLASTLSRTSEILNMMIAIVQPQMSGPVGDFALKLSEESEAQVMAAGSLLQSLRKSSFPRALNGLVKKVKFFWKRRQVIHVTRALERIDRRFGLVLQLHEADMTQHLLQSIQNTGIRSTELQNL